MDEGDNGPWSADIILASDWSSGTSPARSLADAITTSLPGIIMVWLFKGSGQM